MLDRRFFLWETAGSDLSLLIWTGVSKERRDGRGSRPPGRRCKLRPMVDPRRPIGLLGFGEAGFHIARGLRSAGAPPLVAFDIKAHSNDAAGERIRARAAETETRLLDTPRALAERAHVILSLVTAGSARDAAESVAAALSPDHLYVDFNSVSPSTKQQVAAGIGRGARRFVEGSIMAPVPGAGHRVPILLNGPSAPLLADALSPYHMRLDVMDSAIGAAAAAKMRSE